MFMYHRDIPRTPFLAFIVPFGKTIHDAETFCVVVEGQVVINGVEIIEALFLTYSQFYIFNKRYPVIFYNHIRTRWSCEPILLT
jgi:hypothetical protein